jgi:hypothetical protein
MSIKPNLLSLCLLGAFLLSSCDKGEPTVIQGVVTDRKTGAPVEGARVRICVAESAPDPCLMDVVFTDADGMFFFSVANVYKVVIVWDVYKEGYINYIKTLGMEDGKDNFPEIKLIPLDGIVELEIRHEQTNTSDSLFLFIDSKSYLDAASSPNYRKNLDKYPLVLPVGELYKGIFIMPADEYTRIFWGDYNFDQKHLAPNVDSVWVVPQDTTRITISF